MSDHMKCPMKLGQEDESCDHECEYMTWLEEESTWRNPELEVEGE